MKLSIELSATQAERLRHEAERLGLSPEEAAADVVREFEELYRRLA